MNDPNHLWHNFNNLLPNPVKRKITFDFPFCHTDTESNGIAENSPKTEISTYKQVNRSTPKMARYSVLDLINEDDSNSRISLKSVLRRHIENSAKQNTFPYYTVRLDPRQVDHVLSQVTPYYFPSWTKWDGDEPILSVKSDDPDAIIYSEENFPHVDYARSFHTEDLHIYEFLMEAGVVWFIKILKIEYPRAKVQFLGTNYTFSINIDSPRIHKLYYGMKEWMRYSFPTPCGASNDFPDRFGDIRESLISCYCFNEKFLGNNNVFTWSSPGLVGKYLEVKHVHNNQIFVWFAQIKINIGGYLRLKWLDVPKCGLFLPEFWLFCTATHIHPVGHGHRTGLVYGLPNLGDVVGDSLIYLLDGLLGLTFTIPSYLVLIPTFLFEKRFQVPNHNLSSGFMVEAVDLETREFVFPAKIGKIVDDYVVVLHSLDSKQPSSFYSLIDGILPPIYAQNHKFRLTAGDGKTPYKWNKIGDKTRLYAPRTLLKNVRKNTEFRSGMKIEVVDPRNPERIFPATIINTAGFLIFVRLSHSFGPQLIYMYNSPHVLPFGWAESHNYHLSLHESSSTQSLTENDYKILKNAFMSNLLHCYKVIDRLDDCWSPPIHVNPFCACGNYLKKNKMMRLPKVIGPGPLPLVIESLCSHLIDASNNSARIIQILADVGHFTPSLEIIVKDQSNDRHKFTICHSRTSLPEFLQRCCIKLNSCSNLFSFEPRDDGFTCPFCNKSRLNYLSRVLRRSKKFGTSNLDDQPNSVDDNSERTVESNQTNAVSPFSQRKVNEWTSQDLYEYLKTTECSVISQILKNQNIDGYVFLLLNRNILRDYLQISESLSFSLMKIIKKLSKVYSSRKTSRNKSY